MRKVLQCMVVLPQCVCLPAGLLHCTSQTAGSQVCPTVAVVPTTAQTLFSATFAQKLFPYFAQARPGADSVQALLRRPRRHACSCQGDDLQCFCVLCSWNKTSPSGLPSRFQSHPSHLRRPSYPRHLAGAQPPLYLRFHPGGVALRAQGPCGSKEGPRHRQWSYQGSDQVVFCSCFRHLDSHPSILH